MLCDVVLLFRNGIQLFASVDIDSTLRLPAKGGPKS
jgi:hypothetical protein